MTKAVASEKLTSEKLKTMTIDELKTSSCSSLVAAFEVMN